MKIPELRSRILYTLGLLFVARVGANIPLPGINPQAAAVFLCRPDGQLVVPAVSWARPL